MGTVQNAHFELTGRVVVDPPELVEEGNFGHLVSRRSGPGAEVEQVPVFAAPRGESVAVDQTVSARDLIESLNGRFAGGYSVCQSFLVGFDLFRGATSCQVCSLSLHRLKEIRLRGVEELFKARHT